MKQIIRLSFLLFSLSIAFPQTSGKVVGVVKGEDGTPLYGANVFIKGTARGASAQARLKDAKLVPKDQAKTRFQDCSCCRDAADHHDLLAHVDLP